MMKYIFAFFTLIFSSTAMAAPDYQSSTQTGSCHNSYFIEKNTDILSTMNLLISDTSNTGNQFTCSSYTLDQTKNKDYNLVIRTSYNQVPYILQFIGRQSENNNGIVFIPSDALIINSRNETTVSHYTENQIIGACMVRHDGDKLVCLIALKNEDVNTFAIKIHFR